jgi:hypothetical protein
MATPLDVHDGDHLPAEAILIAAVQRSCDIKGRPLRIDRSAIDLVLAMLGEIILCLVTVVVTERKVLAVVDEDFVTGDNVVEQPPRGAAH